MTAQCPWLGDIGDVLNFRFMQLEFVGDAFSVTSAVKQNLTVGYQGCTVKHGS